MLTIATIFSLLSTIALAAPTTKRAYSTVYIQPTDVSTAESGYCLATSSSAANDVSVNFIQCSSTQSTDPTAANYALWDVDQGEVNAVKLSGTNYCLDAGTTYGGGYPIQAKIYTCYNGLGQQEFVYNSQKHLEVDGVATCLASVGEVGQFVHCQDSDISHIQSFYLNSANFPTVPMGGRQIHPNGDNTQCLTIIGLQEGQVYDGAHVQFQQCGNENRNFQQWSFDAPGKTAIKFTGQNYCLDFGTGGGSDGTQMKVWTCYDGLFQQTLYYTTDNHIAVYNGNQCLDVKDGTHEVQSWQCSGTDYHQLFTLNQ